MTLYIFLFLLTFAFSFILIPVAKKLSLRYNLYDNPSADSLKVHKAPISFFGGIAIAGSFLVGILIIWGFKRYGFFEIETQKLLAVFAGGAVAWFYGFFDDMRWQRYAGVSQLTKIIAQIPLVIAIALFLYVVGIWWQFIPFAPLGILIGAFYLLALMNAMNVQDGLDGLAGGITLISCLAFLVLFVIASNTLGVLAAAALAGSVTAFMIFNWHPASIFMGNNGSYFLGILVAIFVLMNSGPFNPVLLIAPLLIAGMPIFNVFFVITRRIIKRQAVLLPDRRHFYDEISLRVPSTPKSVLINYLIHIFFVISGLAMLLI